MFGTPAYMAPEQARDPTQVSAASDVFSLGGTLLFAATGHPPYSGETTADVLVQLATGLPDLTGLPAELNALVTDCLNRSPGQRPSSAAILARLGPFAEDQSYLPAFAREVIEENRLGHQPATHTDRSRGDDTSASIPMLPASAHPELPRLPMRLRVTTHGWQERARRRFSGAGMVAAGAALIVVGVIFGATLGSSDNPRPEPQHTSSAAVTSPTSPPGIADKCTPGKVAPTAALCMSRTIGGPSDSYTVQGSGFTPQTSVSVSLTWYSPPLSISGSNGYSSANKPVTVNQNGAFRFIISQLFPGGLQLGIYQVKAVGSNGDVAQATFEVAPQAPSS